MKPYTYTNSNGETFYLHVAISRAGRRVYVMRKGRGPGWKARLPKGYEIRENVHGRVSVRRARQRQITEAEENLIRNHLTRLRPVGYVLDVVGRAATVYASALDRKTFAESLDAEFANGFADALAKALEGRYSPDLVAMFRQRRKDAGHTKRLRFYPLLRFLLVDRQARRFAVERVCFTGEAAWARLEVLALAPAIMKYLPHLGRDSFFDLI